MRNFLIGLIMGTVGVSCAMFCYFRFGLAPVSTDASPIPFEKYLARTALHRRMTAAAGDTSPIGPSEENLMAGARIYRSSCVACHGLPGGEKTCFQKGLYPRPPSLLHGKGVTDDPVGGTHWVVQNGIRLTGMPSFRGSLTDTGLWQVSLLLAKAQELPPAVQEALAQPMTETDCSEATPSRVSR